VVLKGPDVVAAEEHRCAAARFLRAIDRAARVRPAAPQLERLQAVVARLGIQSGVGGVNRSVPRHAGIARAVVLFGGVGVRLLGMAGASAPSGPGPLSPRMFDAGV
jgi:hypothetical protein